MQILLGLSVFFGLLVIIGLCVGGRSKYRGQPRLNVPEGQTAHLDVKTIARVVNCGTVMSEVEHDIDPQLWSERERLIKNHTTIKTDNLNAMDEYYKQAKILLAKEAGWSPNLDIRIAQMMLKQGYEEKKIIDTMKFISPCAAGILDKDFLTYGHYIVDKVKGTLVENPIEKKSYSFVSDRNEKSLPTVKDLSPNPDSKSLFEAYAREITDKNGQVWTVHSNRLLVENMLRDGRTSQRIIEALRHSPVPIEKAYYFVKEIKANSELQQTRNTGKSIG